MTVNFNALILPNQVADMMHQGWERGRNLKRQLVRDQALAAYAADPQSVGPVNALLPVDPELAASLREQQRGERLRSAYGRLVAPAGGGQSALGAYASGAAQPQVNALAPSNAPPPQRNQPTQTMAGALPATQAALDRQAESMAPAGGMPVAPMPAKPMASAAPSQLLHPSQLPPRTDGLRLNQEALMDIYREDPVQAMKIQSMIYDADKDAFQRMRDHGERLGAIAVGLADMRLADGSPDMERRRAALQAVTPDLVAMGIPAESIPQADLSDAGLDRYRLQGLKMSELLDDQRANARLDIYRDNTVADNARADRNTDSLIADRNARRDLTERGQAMTDARMRRGQDISSRDRTRGQDLTDKRVRDGVGRKAAIVDVKSPAEAKALKPGTQFRTPDGRVMVR